MQARGMMGNRWVHDMEYRALMTCQIMLPSTPGQIAAPLALSIRSSF